MAMAVRTDAVLFRLAAGVLFIPVVRRDVDLLERDSFWFTRGGLNGPPKQHRKQQKQRRQRSECSS